MESAGSGHVDGSTAHESGPPTTDSAYAGPSDDATGGGATEGSGDGPGSPGPVDWWLYEVGDAATDVIGEVRGFAGETPAPLPFQRVEYSARARWKTWIARLATNGPVELRITLPTEPEFATLRTPTSILPSTIDGRDVVFRLPRGPANYMLKTGSGYPLETIAIFVDEYDALPPSPPPGALVLTPADDIQSIVGNARSGTVLYFTPGVYEFVRMKLVGKHGVSFVFAPDVWLRQRSEDKGFIEVEDCQDITFAGPVRIQTPDGNTSSSFSIKRSDNVRLADFFLHKEHENDGWTLHVHESDHVDIEHVRIFSGNDGTDPDASSNVRYDGVYIASQDDAVAIKTRSDRFGSHNVTVNDCFAKSAASALKIGAATVHLPVEQTTFSNCTVFDSDRAMVVNPTCSDDCSGSIGQVRYDNVSVVHVHHNNQGRTIRVEAEPYFFEGTSVVLSDIDADFVVPAVLQTKVEIVDSHLRVHAPMTLFEGVCPDLVNVQVEWLAGVGQLCAD